MKYQFIIELPIYVDAEDTKQAEEKVDDQIRNWTDSTYTIVNVFEEGE